MSNLLSDVAVINFGYACVLAVFGIGLLCFFIRPSAFRQIAGLKLMLQSVSLGLILSGWQRQDLDLVQSMIISALVVEAVVIGLALTMIIRMRQQKQLTESEEMESPGKRNDGTDG